MTKIEYWEDDETPENSGWYINSYGSFDDMRNKSPEDSVGPYDTKTQALRIFHETNSEGEELHGETHP